METKAPIGPAITLRIRRSCDWAYVLVCGLGCPLFFWAAIWADFAEGDFTGMKFEALVNLLFQIIGPIGFNIVAAIFAAVTGAVAIGAVWRLRDPSPTLVAGPVALEFHRTIYHRAIPWNEIEAVRITSGRPTQLEIKLSHRIISFYKPLTSRSVQIPLMVTDWTYRQAEKNVREMRRWKRESAKGR